MDAKDEPGQSPSNLPRMDLLHSGNNSQVQAIGGTAGGSYGAGSLTAGRPVATPTPPPVSPPAPAPKPVAAPAPTAAQVHQVKQAAAPAVRQTNVTSDKSTIPVPKPAPPPTVGPKKSRRWPWVIVVLIVLLAAGAAVWYFFFRNQAAAPAAPAPAPVAAAPVAPTGLTIADGDSKTAIAPGGATKQTKPTFGLTILTKATTGSFTAQVEVEPLGTPFTGTPTVTSSPISATGHDVPATVVAATALAQGSYHWQARVGVDTQNGDWTPASSTATTADFIIDTTAPSAPVLSTVGGSAAKAGGTVTVKDPKPVFAGTAEPNAKVNLTIAPGTTALTAAADAKGAWSITPTADLTAGDHAITLTASDPAGNASPAVQATVTYTATTATATPPPPPAPVTPAATPPSVPTPTPAPAPLPAKLANTGEPTQPLTIAAALTLLLSILGIVMLRRREQRTS